MTTNVEARWLQFLAGDEAAFSELYLTFYRDLYGYGQRVLQHEEDTRNQIHELFLYLWEHRAQLKPVHSVKAYLIISFRNRIFRFLARKRMIPTENVEQRLERDGFHFSSEDLLVAAESDHERVAGVAQAINELPARQREVIYLHYYHELTIQEIADALSLNYQSVANCLQKAYKKLRQQRRMQLLRTLLSLALPFSLLLGA
ncbi:RNA polymerase sigma factor, sigma-70 family [Catalinimonas alkaloidigena]|uniref:RNA polymerase sigma factor, sigma-70 family n=1 Tax=Catalinimonas alkaloidigena TaxID=1075417 RepID=A0A1G9IVZ4_9BACT|nr:sigma-70 family RNA polymerase sigma factor [Catalinimonas alkaloidigena]SDL29123.1 RNA polymerase sigma factor, sigma-70 family [Catalinimonas alkaloidigena]